jgi:hypothetical protein
MDCFVAAAPRSDFGTQFRILAASFTRVLPERFAFRIQRAQGMPGARPAPIASHANEKSIRVSHHRSAEHPGIPCAMVYSLFRALLGDRAFLPPSPARCGASSPNLTPASGRQDHTTSPSARSIARPSAPLASIASRTPRS